MNVEISNLNIPELTVNDAISKLSYIYCAAVEKGIPFKAIPTPFLWGAPGVGKSQGMYQLADNISRETGKRTVVTDVRLLLYTPVDLIGLPIKVPDEDAAKWLKPKIFQMDDSGDVVNILFLDELSAAPQTVQAAAYQICLDRKIGEHKLPENCIVVAAGNRMTDKSVSYKMPKALCNRLMHFQIRSDYSSWRAWAVENNISPLVTAFLGFNSERICMEPSNSDLAYCTPRSWEFVSTLLNTTGQDPQSIHELVAACIGTDAAIEFEAFCKGTLDMPSVDLIIEGKCTELPKSHSVMYALISALSSRVIEMSDRLNTVQLENIFCYVKRFPKDFTVSFVNDIISNAEINQKLMKCQSFQQWLAHNKLSF